MTVLGPTNDVMIRRLLRRMSLDELKAAVEVIASSEPRGIRGRTTLPADAWAKAWALWAGGGRMSDAASSVGRTGSCLRSRLNQFRAYVARGETGYLSGWMSGNGVTQELAFALVERLGHHNLGVSPSQAREVVARAIADPDHSDRERVRGGLSVRALNAIRQATGETPRSLDDAVRLSRLTLQSGLRLSKKAERELGLLIQTVKPLRALAPSKPRG